MALVQAEGFDPAAFEWKTATQDERDKDYAITFRNTVSVLVHKETSYYFRFEKYRSKYSPAHQLRTGIECWNQLDDRDVHVRNWLFNLRMEVTEHDRINASCGSEADHTSATQPARNDSSPQIVFAATSTSPRAFVSYCSQDRAFVEKFAADLRGFGVDAWYDKWEIKTGDPIRAKIDEGLEGCDFFVIVISRASVIQPWVKMELDAATARKVNGNIRKIIPVKLDDCSDLPPTLTSLCWEDFSSQPYDSALRRILDSIFDVDVRPPLGNPLSALDPPSSTTSIIVSSEQKGANS